MSFFFLPFFTCVFDVYVSVWFVLAQTRVPNSPNQPINPPTPWEAEPVVEESGAVEDANAENLYLMGALSCDIHEPWKSFSALFFDRLES